MFFVLWKFEDESSYTKSGCVACGHAASVVSCILLHKITVSAQSLAELHLTIHKSLPMSASVTPLSSSSSSPLTTMFLSPCASTLSSHTVLTLSKVKRKNDNTVLKYGSSPSFSFLVLFANPFLVEAPSPMVCPHYDRAFSTYPPQVSGPGKARHHYRPRLRPCRSLQIGQSSCSSFFSLSFLVYSSVQPTLVSP